MTEAEAEGVDLTDGGALQVWMDNFNTRPFEERDRILGPSLAGAAGATPAPRRTHQQRRQQRKRARAARRRNRR